MSISPDTDVLYSEAIGLEERVAAQVDRYHELEYIQRQRILELLKDPSYHPDAGDQRWHIAAMEANLELKETHGDLYTAYDAEEAALEGIDARNRAIVAAGWAEQFAMNSWARGMRDRKDPELESGKKDKPVS